MRNEMVTDGLIITTDNAAAIGEKALDQVNVPDRVAAKFAARVALAEQWAAGGQVSAILLHNFSGELHWPRYISGIEELFSELGMKMPPVTGSTESNMETLQSALAVTMIGRKVHVLDEARELQWFVYGEPLTGEAVLTHADRIADLRIVHTALEGKLIERIWPVGSQGIEQEAEKLFGQKMPIASWVTKKASGGPATCLLIGVKPTKVQEAQRVFGKYFKPLIEEPDSRR